MKKILMLFLSSFLVSVAFAQELDSLIVKEIQKITVAGYSSHFDSLRCSAGHNRKVIPGKIQMVDHDACRDYIYRKLVHYLGDSSCYIHRFNSFRHKGLANVLGYKEGAKPESGVWLVCAHYDSNNNLSDEKGSNIPSPGANDNGTGLAALLEIARVVSQLELESSVLFAAWDLEEKFKFGFPVGSNKWFRKYIRRRELDKKISPGEGGSVPLKSIVGCINFDMFGNPQRDDSVSAGLRVCYSDADHFAFAQSYAQTMNIYVPGVCALVYGPMSLSDHYTFAARGVPAVENLESAYRNDPYYHTSKDHILNVHNVDFEFATEVTKGGCAFLLENARFVSSPVPK